MTPRRIIGVEKNYDWGDHVAIRQSLGVPPTPGTKIAELWWGTHPQGPAHLDSVNGPLLSDVAGDMNMLVKLLSCEQPLSLQTHPTVEQAREGFAREEAAGISRSAPERMYRDESDKPEMIVALTRFEALCGFAPNDKSVEFLRSLGWAHEADILANEGIAHYLQWAFQQSSAPSIASAPPWLQNIAALYPNDKALRVAPLLNHVVLNEGEALSLPAGNLHAYVHGMGLEVMNSSDNVIRAGFTSKHIDVNELLRIVDTTPLVDPVVHVNGTGEFASPSPQFTVGVVETVNQHSDCHRIAFGRFDGATNNDAVFIEAGSRANFTSATGYVCTQH